MTLPKLPTEVDERLGQQLHDDLVNAMAKNIPDHEMSPEARHQAVDDFMEAVSELVEFIRQWKPSAARSAAIMFTINKLKIEETRGVEAKVIITLVESSQLLVKAAEESLQAVHEAEREVSGGN